MACTIINGREIDCRDSIGGIAEVYITEWANVPQANITATSGTITAMSCSSGKKFFTFQLEKENASFTETENSSVENGTLFYESNLNFTIKKMSAANRNALNILAKNRLMVIVKDNNGLIYLMGQVNGADKIGENNATSGKAFGDMNGYALNFTAKEPNPVNTLSQAILSTLLV
jgi:hypothetical protein